MMPQPIGHTVDAVLQDTLWKLIAGEIEMHHLSPGLSAWFMAGANVHGENCCQAEIERLTRERDYWYCLYANGWTPGEYLRRQTAALWTEAA